LGRLEAVSTTHPAAGVLASFAYDYDVDAVTGEPAVLGGRLRTHSTQAGLGLAGAVTSFAYDEAYQVTAAQYPASAPFDGALHEWTYDLIGNRTQSKVNGVAVPYVYPPTAPGGAGGQLLASAGPASSYEFDLNGDLVARDGPEGASSLVWDRQRRVRSIAGPAGGATFMYDYRGRRTLRDAGGVTRFLYHDDQAVATAGVDAAEYLYGPGTDEVLAVSHQGAVYFYAVDGLGSVVGVHDAAGQPVAQYAYSAWGEPLAGGSVPFTSLGFTGREAEVSGFWYYRARLYEAGVGRFVSEDPLRVAPFGSADPLGEDVDGGLVSFEALSAYAYVLNNPIDFVDPDGLSPRPPPGTRLPPGYDPATWRFDPGRNRFFDPHGGEHHFHPFQPGGRDWHPEWPRGHWDYNPRFPKNSPWQKLPPEVCPRFVPYPWWRTLPFRLFRGPIPITINPCLLAPGLCSFRPAESST
jgi:RHS repeat-associated protein